MRRIRRQYARGMTLIEIMVVLVILGMIAAAIGYSTTNIHKEALKRETKLDVQALANAVDLFRMRHGSLPDALEQLVPNEVPHLRKDPWGNAYVYVHNGDTFEVLSYGPDKSQGGGDDISSAATEST